MDPEKGLLAYSANTAGADKLLKTLGYTLGTLSHCIGRKSKADVRISIALNQLANQISMSRYPLRFLGMLECTCVGMKY